MKAEKIRTILEVVAFILIAYNLIRFYYYAYKYL